MPRFIYTLTSDQKDALHRAARQASTSLASQIRQAVDTWVGSGSVSTAPGETVGALLSGSVSQSR